jgi:hypothetical protein
VKTFLAIYTGTPESMEKWRNLSESEQKSLQQQGIAAWYAWGDRHKDVILDMGAPLGKTKSVSRSGIADIRNAMTAYSIVKAESHDAAARLFENHPHFTIFPGDAVEVMEILPIPGQNDK